MVAADSHRDCREPGIGIALIDLHGSPIETNPALQHILGYSAQEFESMHFTDVVHPDEMDQARAFYTGLVNGDGGQLRAEARCIRKDGQVIWCNTYIFLVCDSNGAPQYVVSMMEDITERKRAEEALQREREFTRTLLDSLADGVVACDADGKLVLFNRIARDWHGMAPAGDPPETWATRYHLHDADSTATLPTEEIPLMQTLRGETVHDTHLVICAPDQPARHVIASGGPFFDKNGDKLGAVVAMHDITARKRAEQALAREQYLMRILMDHVPDSIYFKDSQSRFIRINQAAAERLGFSNPAQAMGKTDFDVFTPEHAQPAYEDEQEIMHTGQPIVAKEEVETWTNRPTAWVSTTKMPLRDEAGNIIGTFGISRDITERKRIEEKLLYISTHDVLSGLYNRAYFEQALAHLTHGEQYPISAVMIDVDRMKLTNDTLGHAARRGFRTRIIEQVRLHLAEGYAGRAALERRTVRYDQGRVANSGPPNPQYLAMMKAEGFVSHVATPLIAQGQVTGVLEVFHRAALDANDEWLEFMEMLARQAAISIHSMSLFEGLQRSKAVLELAYDTTLEGWSHALDLRDKETEGHTLRVAEVAERIAREMGVSRNALVHLHRGALLHDIGKMGIPDNILLKPGPLTDEEWAIMRKHPQYAYEMLYPIKYLRPALDIPYCHHERWDGTGYPRGLQGEQIPLAARIFTVADVWDALSSDRPYRVAWPEEKLRDNIRAGAGTHFDPHVVAVFLRLQNA